MKQEPQTKLDYLYRQCLQELQTIGINMEDKKTIGTIQITLSKRNNKRYGCCKQEKPDQHFKVIQKIGRRKIIKYEKFYQHTIEISKWLMELDDSIIKNTIMHELIHCIPFCNNHQKEFKKYATYINQKLGYDIQRVGNKKEDYEKSGKTIEEKEEYLYKIVCQKCGQEIYRKRFNTNLLYRYYCARCKGKLKLVEKR